MKPRKALMRKSNHSLFATIRCFNAKFQTETIPQTPEAEWNKPNLFHFHQQPKRLILEVFKHNKLMQTNEYIGNDVLYLDELFKAGSEGIHIITCEHSSKCMLIINIQRFEC